MSEPGSPSHFQKHHWPVQGPTPVPAELFCCPRPNTSSSKSLSFVTSSAHLLFVCVNVVPWSWCSGRSHRKPVPGLASIRITMDHSGLGSVVVWSPAVGQKLILSKAGSMTVRSWWNAWISKWKEENSQRLQLTGDPLSLFLSSCWQKMNHQIYEEVGKDLIWVMWPFPGNLPWLCEGLFTVFCHV